MLEPSNARFARSATLAAALAVAFAPVVSAYASGGQGQGTQTFVDQPPTIAITSPVNGAGYARGETVAAAYSCTATAPAHLAACTGPIPSGSPIPTATPGPHFFTVSARDSDGGTATRTVVYVVGEGPTTSSQPSSTPPAIAELSQSSAAWREGRTLAKITRASASAVGTIFSFSLNEAAAVSFSFTRTGSSGKCPPVNRQAAGRTACTRGVGHGLFAFPAHAGTNKVAFDGLLSPAAKLRPGRYTVALTATDNGGRSAAPQSLNFTILP